MVHQDEYNFDHQLSDHNFCQNSVNQENVDNNNNSSSSNANYWTQIAEATMPLKQSKMASVNRDYTQMNNGSNGANYNAFSNTIQQRNSFNASIELCAKEISRKLILVNAISLIINLLLAVIAFYFSFVNNSSATGAFAADCVLDFISSAIVLWRYCGSDNLTSVYRHAREQIACIYLGALFEISAIAIIVTATSDIVGGANELKEYKHQEKFADLPETSYDLVYLAVAATIACCILTVFKCALYQTIRDNSILLDVINTLISTVFAMSIIMSQLLINVNPSFWYLDPIISIVLAIFLAAFGLKVIHQNFNVLRPVYRQTNNGSSMLRSFSANHFGGNNFYHSNNNKHSSALLLADQSVFVPNQEADYQQNNFGANLNTSIEFNRNRQVRSNNNNVEQQNWQKSDYSSIAFI